MKNNYPIKYAVIPMIEQVGWTHGLNELERKYGIVCYIVSKCYLVKETKKYERNGLLKQKYHVVCPYEGGEYNIWKIDEPSNPRGDYFTNDIIVDNIYDSFEEARIDKDEKNRKLLLDKTIYLPVKDIKEKSKKIEEEFNKILSYYNELESKIEENTQYLVVNGEPKRQTVIYRKDNEYSSNISLYQMVDVFDYLNYIAYSLTKEEFKELIDSIKNKLPVDKFSNKPLLINNKNLKITKVVSTGKKNKYLVDGKICDKTNEKFIVPSKFDVILYTIEDYEDIINSYIDNSDKKVIKLTRKD